MKRVVLAIAGTVTALVMLLSFKTQGTSVSATPPASSTPSTSGSTSGSSGSSGSSSTAGGSSSGAGSGTAQTSAAKTYTGQSADTQYGPVQVQITVKNGKVAGARAVEYPTGTPMDAQINAYAIPVLNQEAAATGSAHIDMVSGATYTSQGYLDSLQSALNEAGL